MSQDKEAWAKKSWECRRTPWIQQLLELTSSQYAFCFLCVVSPQKQHLLPWTPNSCPIFNLQSGRQATTTVSKSQIVISWGVLCWKSSLLHVCPSHGDYRNYRNHSSQQGNSATTCLSDSPYLLISILSVALISKSEDINLQNQKKWKYVWCHLVLCTSLFKLFSLIYWVKHSVKSTPCWHAWVFKSIYNKDRTEVENTNCDCVP